MGWPYYSFDCLMLSLLDSLKYIWMKSCSSETYSLRFFFLVLFYGYWPFCFFIKTIFTNVALKILPWYCRYKKNNNDVVDALADVDYSTKGRFWRAWSSYRISGSRNWYRNWIIASCFLAPAFCLLHSRFLTLAPASHLILPCSCLLGPGSFLLVPISWLMPPAPCLVPRSPAAYFLGSGSWLPTPISISQ